MMKRFWVAFGLIVGTFGFAETTIAQTPIAQTTPAVIQTGPQSGTTNDLKMPIAPGVGSCQGKSCPPVGIRFKPGQRIKVEIFNRTDRPISIEKVAGSVPLQLQGKSKISFYQGGRSENASIVFWEKNETPLRVKLAQPKPDILFIDLSFAPKKPGDQSVYVRNDGRVDIF